MGSIFFLRLRYEITTTKCVRTQKNEVIICFAAEVRTHTMQC